MLFFVTIEDQNRVSAILCTVLKCFSKKTCAGGKKYFSPLGIPRTPPSPVVHRPSSVVLFCLLCSAVANVAVRAAVLGAPLQPGAADDRSPKMLAPPDALRLRVWATEQRKLQEIYLQMVCEAVLARDWDACLDALTHFLSAHAAHASAGGQARVRLFNNCAQ